MTTNSNTDFIMAILQGYDMTPYQTSKVQNAITAIQCASKLTTDIVTIALYAGHEINLARPDFVLRKDDPKPLPRYDVSEQIRVTIDTLLIGYDEIIDGFNKTFMEIAPKYAHMYVQDFINCHHYTNDVEPGSLNIFAPIKFGK